jgi:Helix-turn-helix domain
MPWKECSVVEERLRFVARLLDGEAMTELCLEFGISRNTGYKILDRYKEHGLEALTDRSRRPVRYANQLPSQVGPIARFIIIAAGRRSSMPWGSSDRLSIRANRASTADTWGRERTASANGKFAPRGRACSRERSLLLMLDMGSVR